MSATKPDNALTKFDATDGKGIRRYFGEHGYVILRSLLHTELIDRFLHEYERIKKNITFVYDSQSIHRVIRPSLNERGYIKESMENASRLGLFPRFSGAIKRCIYDERISNTLSCIDGRDRHAAWQDMFFDLSPSGSVSKYHVSACSIVPVGWFALEDIDQRAGTFFFVMPGAIRLRHSRRRASRITSSFGAPSSTSSRSTAFGLKACRSQRAMFCSGILF